MDAQEDAIGMKELLHGRTLAKELRIDCHPKARIATPAIGAQKALQLRTSSYGGRTSLHDESRRIPHMRNLSGG